MQMRKIQNRFCFKIVDSNKDGEITFQEFEKYFENDNERFKEADLDNNGKLSHIEYHELFGHGSWCLDNNEEDLRRPKETKDEPESGVDL